MTAPILFLIFNRPGTTAMVLEAIRRAAPTKLYIAADGPRAHIAGENERVQTVRDLVIQGIDWPCEIHTRFQDSNLGCKQAVSSAISWFFDHEEEGIILEDDCIADPDFFPFCEQMLERFRHDQLIASINGNHLTGTKRHTTHDYYFTIFPNVWGWATWRRVWKHYDAEIKAWPEWKRSGELYRILSGKYSPQAAVWEEAFDSVYQGRLDTWDHQFVFVLFSRGWLAVQPCHNLVRNAGHGLDATHTNDPYNPRANQPTLGLDFPLKHPTKIVRSFFIEEHLVNERRIITRLVRRIKRVYNMALGKNISALK